MKDVQILNAANGAVDQVSVPTVLGDIKNFSIHIDFSGTTLAGTLTLEADDMQRVYGTADWITITGSSQVVTGAQSHMYNVTGAGYSQVRCKWVAGSGTGTINMALCLKEDGLNRN